LAEWYACIRMLPRLAQMLSYLAENYECILKFLSLLVLKRFTHLSQYSTPYYYTTAPQYEGRKDRSTLLRILSSQRDFNKNISCTRKSGNFIRNSKLKGALRVPLATNN
jgi:hypothetical protein